MAGISLPDSIQIVGTYRRQDIRAARDWLCRWAQDRGYTPEQINELVRSIEVEDDAQDAHDFGLNFKTRDGDRALLTVNVQ